MSTKFSVKKLSCSSYAEVPVKTSEAELSWLSSLLLRARVPQIMIDKALADNSYDKASWRDFLFDTYGIIIIKNVSKHKVVITKVDTDSGDKVILGEWLKPEVVRIKGQDAISYEINLKYWQII